MIKNFIFDLGNVLVDYNPMRCILGYTHNISDANYIASEVFASPEWIELDRGTLSYESALEIWKTRVPERLHSCLDEVIANYHKNLPEKLDMTSIVKRLKAKGNSIYILSNVSERFDLIVEDCTFMGYIDGRVLSWEEKAVKPSPEIYVALLNKFSLSPEECIFIDDSADNVRTAKKFGMAGYIFDGDVKKLEKTFTELGFTEKEEPAVLLEETEEISEENPKENTENN